MLTPSPATGLSARARRARRVVVPAAVTCSLVAGALASVLAPADSAFAATTGSYTVTNAPVALNQAVDPGWNSITPTADAASNGMFGAQADWPLLPLHATVARNGHVITYGSPLGGSAQNGVAFDDWDTSAGFSPAAHVDTASMHGYDSFCNSAVTLMDGRLLMVSGQLNYPTSSESMTMFYDPATRTQDMGEDIAYKRWYVTALRLTDTRILLLGGGDAGNTSAYENPNNQKGVATTPEIGTGTGAWTSLTGADSAALFGAEDNHWWYPRAFNGPNGDVVGLSGDRIWSLSTAGDGSVHQTGVLPFNPKVSGSQVMFAPGRVLVAGGGEVHNVDDAVATNEAAIVDFRGDAPVVRSTAAMARKRNWLNLTVLPNGEVLANGGTTAGTAAGADNSVRQSEIWNPATGAWRVGATAQRTRTYHSTSLLLPSGAVLTAGGGGATFTGSGTDFGPENNLNAELYYPSYLFTKDVNGTVQWAPRPAITAISGSATYGGDVQLSIGDGRRIASASLITLPSVTHSQNTDQRRIPLEITQTGRVVTATLPGSVNTMPPGDYELTVVDTDGVPSAAQIITVRKGQAGLVTVGSGTPVSNSDAGAGLAPVGAVTNDPGTAATGTAPVPGTAGAAPAPVVSAPGAPPASGTQAPVATGSGSGSTSTAAPLVENAAIGLAPVARSGRLVGHAGTNVALKHASRGSSSSVRRAVTWIVRTASGPGGGVSLESVDRRGYYLAAPAKRAGAVVLLKKSGSASFAARTTFRAETGVMGHDTSIRLAASPSLYLRTLGMRLTLAGKPTTGSGMMASTFAVLKGLSISR